MGLDMYLIGEKFLYGDWNKPENNPRADGFEISNMELRLGYWRKHPNLHGYIVKTFAEGEDECQKIDLCVEDMQKVIEAIKAKSLPYTEGFFFGKSECTDEEASHDIAIFEGAIKWLDQKAIGEMRSVHYRASW